MKNYLIGWQPWETDFNGDRVSMNILPLKRAEFLRLLPVLDAFYKESQKNVDGDGLKSATGMSDMLDQIEGVVSQHVKDISGFEIDGAAPKLDDVLSGSIFMPLVSNIVFRLVEISKVQKDDEKNSDGQSANLQ